MHIEKTNIHYSHKFHCTITCDDDRLLCYFFYSNFVVGLMDLQAFTVGDEGGGVVTQ